MIHKSQKKSDNICALTFVNDMVPIVDVARDRCYIRLLNLNQFLPACNHAQHLRRNRERVQHIRKKPETGKPNKALECRPKQGVHKNSRRSESGLSTSVATKNRVSTLLSLPDGHTKAMRLKWFSDTKFPMNS